MVSASWQWKKIRRVIRRMGLLGKRDQGDPMDENGLHWQSIGEVLGILNRQEALLTAARGDAQDKAG